jgi:hypothetical protein
VREFFVDLQGCIGFGTPGHNKIGYHNIAKRVLEILHAGNFRVFNVWRRCSLSSRGFFGSCYDNPNVGQGGVRKQTLNLYLRWGWQREQSFDHGDDERPADSHRQLRPKPTPGDSSADQHRASFGAAAGNSVGLGIYAPSCSSSLESRQQHAGD